MYVEGLPGVVEKYVFGALMALTWLRGKSMCLVLSWCSHIAKGEKFLTFPLGTIHVYLI